ncbi:pseudouridine synthase [Marinobacter halodurans]|uniref:Pseudouridine synthase n=1 Tax=Marinobacter halodurans TaxID=2528979 RepID=A0ABY1ZNB6_9GAMM|nr:pseudouridine synthase [Marinobacter halodurans]TBW55162.1 pseudouridine synthase [Marinobacter halodurans]
MRLDRFISKHTGCSHKAARQAIAGGRVSQDGITERNPTATVGRFSRLTLDGTVLRSRTAHYLMLHKPAGYLSATTDPQHPTVLELLPEPLRADLHIGGRLDRSSTGLLLLTNDGLWSRRLTEPRVKHPKVYRVTTVHPISPDTAAQFAAGIYLPYERLTTSPAQLEALAGREARLTIYEGRYHQVKRMFAAVGNRVASLHRERMGEIQLDPALAPGDFRRLSAHEIASVG